MKKTIIALLALLPLLFVSCKKNTLNEDTGKTTLEVSMRLKDSPNPPLATVYLWDAAANSFPAEINYSANLLLGRMEDTDGKYIRAVASFTMQPNVYPNGDSDNFRYANINLDNVFSYTDESHGKVLVMIILTETQKFSYITKEWQRGDEIKIQKVFDGVRPIMSREDW